MRARRVLVLLGRFPAPGRCKRRLAIDIGAVAAARVQRQLLAHTLAVANQWRSTTANGAVVIAIGCAQGVGGLGLRMQRQFAKAFRGGARHVVLIGSDLPLLSAMDINDAFEALNQRDLVIGPALDGGYWLIGLNHSNGSIFSGIPWGSNQVLAATTDRAQILGLHPWLLKSRADIDQLQNLNPWFGDCDGDGDG